MASLSHLLCQRSGKSVTILANNPFQLSNQFKCGAVLLKAVWLSGGKRIWFALLIFQVTIKSLECAGYGQRTRQVFLQGRFFSLRQAKET